MENGVLIALNVLEKRFMVVNLQKRIGKHAMHAIIVKKRKRFNSGSEGWIKFILLKNI